jgi:hypothetical protein
MPRPAATRKRARDVAVSQPARSIAPLPRPALRHRSQGRSLLPRRTADRAGSYARSSIPHPCRKTSGNPVPAVPNRASRPSTTVERRDHNDRSGVTSSTDHSLPTVTASAQGRRPAATGPFDPGPLPGAVAVQCSLLELLDQSPGPTGEPLVLEPPRRVAAATTRPSPDLDRTGARGGSEWFFGTHGAVAGGDADDHARPLGIAGRSMVLRTSDVEPHHSAPPPRRALPRRRTNARRQEPGERP